MVEFINKSVSKTHLGTAWPLGSTITEKGVNFSIAAPNASHVELLFFKNQNDLTPTEVISLDIANKSGDYWHIEVEDISIGCLYSYRLHNLENLEEAKRSSCYMMDPHTRTAIYIWGQLLIKFLKISSQNFIKWTGRIQSMFLDGTVTVCL